jgi:hypothetical protein
MDVGGYYEKDFSALCFCRYWFFYLPNTFFLIRMNGCGRHIRLIKNKRHSLKQMVNWAIGVAASSLWHRTHYDRMPNTGKWTNNAKLYILWRK